MSLFLIYLICFLIYSLICWIIYKYRSNSIVIIDFDSVLVDIEHIKKRAEIYVKNNPNKNIGEYIGAHISEQAVKPIGVLEALKYQEQHYKIVFVSSRHESLRLETTKILNEWGLKGILYMNEESLSSVIFKNGLYSFIKNNYRVYRIIDWSNDGSY